MYLFAIYFLAYCSFSSCYTIYGNTTEPNSNVSTSSWQAESQYKEADPLFVDLSISFDLSQPDYLEDIDVRNWPWHHHHNTRRGECKNPRAEDYDYYNEVDSRDGDGSVNRLSEDNFESDRNRREDSILDWKNWPWYFHHKMNKTDVENKSNLTNPTENYQDDDPMNESSEYPDTRALNSNTEAKLEENSLEDFDWSSWPWTKPKKCRCYKPIYPIFMKVYQINFHCQLPSKTGPSNEVKLRCCTNTDKNKVVSTIQNVRDGSLKSMDEEIIQKDADIPAEISVEDTQSSLNDKTNKTETTTFILENLANFTKSE